MVELVEAEVAGGGAAVVVEVVVSAVGRAG
jgi:hypothetical protein